MDNEVSWVFEITLNPGAFDDFKSLAKEQVDANYSSEPGTLNFQLFITGDDTRVHYCERFVDSAAAMFHVARFGETFAARLLELATVTRFEIYGNPSDELKDALVDLSPTYLSPVAGFTR